jgi:hypothetical protein
MSSSLLQDAKLQERTSNFILQAILLIFIFTICSGSLFSEVPAWMLLSQGVHYGLIALADIYEDDYPESNKKNWAYLLLGLLFVWSIIVGLFENPYIRLHAAIILMGNLFGGKVDTTSWKIVFVVYMSTIISYEIIYAELLMYGSSALLYGLFATCIICLCERLSERNQTAWVIHSFIFFTWALFQGAYFQEGVIFLVGGLGYEVVKITFKLLANTNKSTQKLFFS